MIDQFLFELFNQELIFVVYLNQRFLPFLLSETVILSNVSAGIMCHMCEISYCSIIIR